MERIFKLKEHKDGKAFKLVVLKMKGYAPLSYENLKKNREREATSKIGTWFKLKKHVDKRFLPSHKHGLS